MKTIQRNIFGLALMMVMFLSACSEDFPDRMPQANPGTENFFLDFGSAKSAAVAANEAKLYFFSGYLTEPGIRFMSPPGLNKFPEDNVLLPLPQYELDQISMIDSNYLGY